MTRFKPIALSPFFVLALSVFVFTQNELPRVINGGVLNGKAISLPKPVYSDEAKAANIEGVVRVNVVIDESGNVISAEIASESPDRVKRSAGKTEVAENEAVHPLLADAALQAALLAKFSPTLINGGPIKIKGTILYNFVAKARSINTVGTGISGGNVLNGKATSLPLPTYPRAARAVRASGAVTVQVVLSETGEVESASAVSGHPLLRAAAVEAARAAKFSPTTLSGNPVKVSGVLVYNFAAPDEGNK